MKKGWILAAAAGVVGAGTIWLSVNRPRWSVKDPEVLALVEQAEAELGKLYYREAVELLQQAQNKAPDAFAVRYFLVRAYASLGRGREASEYLELLKGMPQERLTSRERMLLELLILRRSGDWEAYLARLLEYQRQYPKEVELARLLALAYQQAGEPDRTEHWGRKLLELNANDALAYNILGYAELARGRFSEAEEQFRKYAYIAPDQANPHDSLGELFLITGRWEEAEAELTQAIRLNPRFYPAWRHLADLALLQGQRAKLLWAVDELAHALDLPAEERAREQAVALGLMGFFLHQPALLGEAAERLPSPGEEWEYFVVHAAALAQGHWQAAQEVEAALERENSSGPRARTRARIKVLLALHRAVAQGQPPQALALASELLKQTSFVNVGQAWTRLMAMRFKAQALEALGREQEAGQVMQQLRSVNPRFPLAQ